MAESLQTDAICVSDDQMVMKGVSYDRQRLITRMRPVSRYIGFLTEIGPVELLFDFPQLMELSNPF